MKQHTATQHPIWAVLREQGRYNLVWLAARTGYSHSYVKHVAAGPHRPGPRFRAACAAVLGLPEEVLFHDDDGSQSSRPVDPDGSESDRAVNVVARAESYSTPQEVAISKTA